MRYVGTINRKILSARSAILDFRIALKWQRDRASLPLTQEHREIYDNLHRYMWETLGRFPNLTNCDDFNDRIQWIKLFDQCIETVRCTDKILLRNHVAERLGEGYCPAIYQVRDSFDEIDLSALPDRFVIKANHDYGSVVIVRNKQQFDRTAARELFARALARRFAWERGEWAYSFVKPQVFVEEYLDSGSAQSPPDYKFLCADGEVKFVHFLYGRGQQLKEQVISVDGTDYGVEFFAHAPYGNTFTRPSNWEEMISCATKLSRGWKFVRVDLYSINGRTYVGEMTFFPAGGAYPGTGQKMYGKMLDFDRSTFRPPIAPEKAAAPIKGRRLKMQSCG